MTDELKQPIGRRDLLKSVVGLTTGLAFAGPRVPASAGSATPAAPAHPPPPELWRASASALAGWVSTREVSSVAIVQSHLDRIAQVNPELNAVAVVLGDEALKNAAAADRAIARGERVGPLHGVPITIKENLDLAGTATTEGLPSLRENVVAIDSPCVAQLKAAGAIPIGRTNMAEMGLRYHTESGLHGATLNPWDASRTPGGSSGGDAVAVATGMTPIGIGNDYGGSVRFPAQCCGVAALRPSRGRVASAIALAGESRFPITIQLFLVHGPLARSVSDLRLALHSMSGADARDPWWTPAPLEGGPEVPRRVAMIVDPEGAGVDPRVLGGVRRAAAALTAAGYVVDEVDSGSVVEAADLWARMIAADIREFFLPLMLEIGSAANRQFVEQLLEAVPPLDRSEYAQALAERNRLTRIWSEFQQEYPLVLGPVSTAQPFPVGSDLGGREAVETLLGSVRLTVAVNLLGLPSVALPVMVADELPQAVQLIGPMYREDLCLAAAETIEASIGAITPIDPRHN